MITEIYVHSYSSIGTSTSFGWTIVYSFINLYSFSLNWTLSSIQWIYRRWHGPHFWNSFTLCFFLTESGPSYHWSTLITLLAKMTQTHKMILNVLSIIVSERLSLYVQLMEKQIIATHLFSWFGVLNSRQY